MFTNTYLPHVGGVARSVSTFAEGLRNSGHQVLIIAPTFAEQEKHEPEDILRVPAIQKFNGSDFSVRIPLPGLISDALESFEPDIIHSHHPFLLGDAALRASRTFKLPLVFTHHTLYERYTHYVPLDSKALQRFAIKLATEYANLCSQVIAPSSSIKQLLKERGVKPEVTVLPTGIDVAYFAKGDGNRFRKEHRIPEDKVVIGHVGRLADEKNLPYLARACAAALKQDDRLHLIVAGSGDAEKEIQSIFHSHQLDDQVVMTGNLTGTSLADCYAAMNLFVFASTSETQGLVLAEAMAASTPVVALEASGVDDVLVDQVNGLMLPKTADEKQFTQAVLSLAGDTDKLKTMQQEAYETAKQFSKQKCGEKLVKLYANAISNEARPDISEIELLDNVILAIKAEWELLQEKTSAAFDTFAKEE